VGTPAARRPVPFPRAVAFFRRHPVLLLLCLTPGIPEYLSGSSSVAGLIVAPGVFFLFLLLNLGLYGPGVLLVREALVRWRKGWLAALLLGGAYGLLEEGTALSTLFDPRASVVGGLGSYGHFDGVSWVWAIGVLGVHIVLSIGLPIVLLGLALPETRGRSLITGRQVPVVFGIWVLDLILLALAAHYYPVGWSLELAAAVVAGGLALAAYRLPAGLLDPTSALPRFRPRVAFVLGLLYFPVLLVVPAVGGDVRLPAVVTGVLDLAFAAALFLMVRRGIGRAHHESQMVALAFGAILPIMVFGFVAQVFLPLVLVPDAVAGAFFFTLWRRYGTDGVPRPTVPGAAVDPTA
jgi:hypothetical protein